MRDSNAVAAAARSATQPVPVEEFKKALSHFASGVTVVTARTVAPNAGAGEDVAMTATAFMSVSLEPPLVLVSVGAGSRMHEVLTRQDEWAVSILNENQAHVSSRFAIRGRVSDRLLFEDLPRHRGSATGAIILDGALSAVECRTVSRVPAGDHLLVLGLVVATEHPAPDSRPLLYFTGHYRGLRDRAAGPRDPSA